MELMSIKEFLTVAACIGDFQICSLLCFFINAIKSKQVTIIGQNTLETKEYVCSGVLMTINWEKCITIDQVNMFLRGSSTK
jgi:hypothetical protein